MRVEVSDDSSEMPPMVDVCRTGGLGLVLIALLASSWGAELQPHHGKRVWFELDACVRAIAAQPSPSPVKGVLVQYRLDAVLGAGLTN